MVLVSSRFLIQATAYGPEGNLPGVRILPVATAYLGLFVGKPVVSVPLRTERLGRGTELSVRAEVPGLVPAGRQLPDPFELTAPSGHQAATPKPRRRGSIVFAVMNAWTAPRPEPSPDSGQRRMARETEAVTRSAAR
ncbi:hypothetical protein [Streptomyces sp. CB00455]|uniref:hypothetical protein n=1 Tax=Streptomyces sp. CB00455 TaxID=1703927 RepID=UPI001F5BC5BB|nr:hypothetical protein [Streptomyces sp. CB00455]